MDLSPILVVALAPFLVLGLGIRRRRALWPLVVLTFPLTGLLLLAATDGHAAGATLLGALWAVVVVVAVLGWRRWGLPPGTGADGVRMVGPAALTVGLGSCAAAVLGAEHGSGRLLPSLVGYGVVGLLVAALVLLAARDARGWDAAFVALCVASVIVLPQAATTFGTWRWGFVALDLVVVTAGALLLLAGRRSWRVP